MGEGYFFTPNAPKLIIPFAYLLTVLFVVLYSPSNCCPPMAQRIIKAISNLENFFLFFLGLLMVYYFSCSFLYFVSTRNQK